MRRHLVDELLEESEAVDHVCHGQYFHELREVVSQVGTLLRSHDLLQASRVVDPLF